ncbi:MAG: putative integral membrane protein (TIGR00698 family) [Phenylobacterium sp.]|jgi:uncharacterized integral membrane protein (TIGR00698 family)
MTLKDKLPGISITIITGLAALFLSEHYGAPAMLFALLLGIAMSFLYQESPCKAGIEFSATFVLRLGVALLGLRIALSDVLSLGWQTIALLALAIASTILIGIAGAKLLGLNKKFGALTGGSVAICGASAAMAITAILPDHKHKERDTLLTVIGVTSLSTIVMVVYPIVVSYLGLSSADAALFLGGTIHDVAQVVGAGYSVSEQTGDLSTLIKLVRVSMLMPVVVIMLLVIKRSYRHAGVDGTAAQSAKVPLFLIAFVALMLLNSWLTIPAPVVEYATAFSRFALITAIAAIGMKSDLAKLTSVGFTPILLMIIETLWIAGFILLAIFIR